MRITADGSVVARHRWAKSGIRLFKTTRIYGQSRSHGTIASASLGDGVAELFGQTRQYVEEIERRAPHAPLALLREVLERESEFGHPLVGAAIESLSQFKVVKLGALSKLLGSPHRGAD